MRNIKQVIKKYVLMGCFLLLFLCALWHLILCRCNTNLQHHCQFLRNSWFVGLFNPSSIKAAISAVGVVSFLLTYLNTARSSRVVGVKLQEVIRYRYGECIIVFLAQAMFSLLGIYAAECGVRLTSGICLTVVMLCMVYAVNLALRIVFKEQWTLQLVKKYVDSYITQKKKRGLKSKSHKTQREQSQKKQQKEEQQETMRLRRMLRNACCVAEYISKCHADLEAFDRAGVQIDYAYLIALCEQLDSESSTKSNIKDTTGDLHTAFCSFFPTTKDDPLHAANHVLLRLPHAEGDFCKTQNCIRNFANIWKSLLSGSNLQSRGELCGNMLHAAARQGNEVLRTKCICGLIVCLHQEYLPDRKSAEEGGWNLYLETLFRIAYMAAPTEIGIAADLETERKRKACFKSMVGDFAYISLFLYELERLTAWRDDCPDLEERIAPILSDTKAEVRYRRDYMTEYVAFAYLIFEMIKPMMQSISSREDMQDILKQIMPINVSGLIDLRPVR